MESNLTYLEFSLYDLEKREERELRYTELYDLYLPKQVISEIEKGEVPSFKIRGIRGDELIPKVVCENGNIRINIPINGPYLNEDVTEVYEIFSFLRRIILNIDWEEKNREIDITYQYQLALINLKLAEIIVKKIMKEYEHKEEKENE